MKWFNPIKVLIRSLIWVLYSEVSIRLFICWYCIKWYCVVYIFEILINNYSVSSIVSKTIRELKREKIDMLLWVMTSAYIYSCMYQNNIFISNVLTYIHISSSLLLLFSWTLLSLIKLVVVSELIYPPSLLYRLILFLVSMGVGDEDDELEVVGLLIGEEEDGDGEHNLALLLLVIFKLYRQHLPLLLFHGLQLNFYPSHYCYCYYCYYCYCYYCYWYC